MKRSSYIPIESVFNIETDSQLWYYIPGFNGYEISNLGNIRSMKHFNQYPYGLLIRCKMNNKGERIFELSNDQNERVRISDKELWNLAMNNPYTMPYYPRATCVSTMDSRNNRIFIKRNKTKYKKKDSISNETFFPHFTVIPDKKDIINPIYFI